jgi:hypothetical protein
MFAELNAMLYAKVGMLSVRGKPCESKEAMLHIRNRYQHAGRLFTNGLNPARCEELPTLTRLVEFWNGPAEPRRLTLKACREFAYQMFLVDEETYNELFPEGN